MTNENNTTLRVGGVSRTPVGVGYQLGWGVDLVTGRLSFPVVSSEDFNTRSAFSENRHLRVVSRTSEYRELSRTVVNAQASGWGASFSAGVDYLRSQRMNSQSVNFVMGTTITIDQKIIDFDRAEVSAEVLGDLTAMKAQNRIGDFVLKYGTHFIGGFLRGGFFMGTFNLQASTRQSAEHLKVTFSASFGSFVSGSVDGSFQRDISRLSSEYTVNASATINGGAPDIFDPIQPQTMKAALNAFSAKLKVDSASPFVALCYPWETLPEIREILGDQKLLPNIDTRVIEALQEAYLALDYAHDTIEQIRSARSWVGKANAHRLDQLDAKIQTDRAAIEALTLDQIAALRIQSPEFAETYQTADAYVEELDMIAAGRTRVAWNASLDGAFQWEGAVVGNPYVLPSNEPVVVIDTIRNNGERAQLGFMYTTDRRLQTFLNIDAGPAWHFLGAGVDDNESESRAIETPYPWNYMNARFE